MAKKKEADKTEKDKKEIDKMEKEQALSLEDAFAQIEEVIGRLETEDITLEQSFAEYNRGMALLAQCNATIDRVEKKVLKINEDGGLDEF